jgi:hypothetical protein
MAQAVPEEGTRFSDPDDISSQVREYVRLKESISHMESRSKEIRETLIERIDTEGEEDGNGNIGLYLDSEIEGVLRLQKTRRASRKLNEEVADEIIETENLGDEIYEMKRVINEDALMAAFYEGKITEEQLDEMFPVTVTWALNTLKK